MSSDSSFYHDSGEGAMKSMKAKMTLDLAGPPAKKSKGSNVSASLLQSPDLQMLKLASPDLERLIIQHNDMITTTPTPTQVSYPKGVTEEQEAYARGFVDALAELHKQSDDPNSEGNGQTTVVPETVSCLQTTSNNIDNNLMTYTSLGNAPNFQTTGLSTTTSLPTMPNTMVGNNIVSQQNMMTSDDSRTSSPALMIKPGQVIVKEEPQTVPCMTSVSPPPSNIHPINLHNQEVIKVERKRARNRQAARKCRTRKLERISRLEERVDELKGQNTDLVHTATTLREQVCQLKQQILQHVTSGCQVMLSHNVL